MMAVCVIFFACSKKNNNHPHIAIETGLGNIEIELYLDKAPVSAGAFLSYIDSGFYNKAAFYRVLNQDNQPSDAFKAALVQGGIWRTKHKLFVSLPGIKHETTKQTGILHKDGTISLARQQPGTASTEFFICLGDQPGFDYEGENNPTNKVTPPLEK
jgi:peptidyl-prolyl cis-trans isomerase A (cyclophilin A)